MNKMTSAVATAALAATAVAITTGTASAAPAPATVPVTVAASAQTVSAGVPAHSVVRTTAVGPIAEPSSRIQVPDATGYTRHGAPFAVAPKAAAVIGSAALTSAKTVSAPLRNIDWTADFNSDLAVAATNFGLATGLGSMVGGVAGVVGGCGIGAVTFGLTFVPTGLGAPLAAAAGCLAGAGLLGSIGPVVGGAVLGVPVAIASAVQMYNTMHAAGEISAPMAVAR